MHRLAVFTGMCSVYLLTPRNSMLLYVLFQTMLFVRICARSMSGENKLKGYFFSALLRMVIRRRVYVNGDDRCIIPRVSRLVYLVSLAKLHPWKSVIGRAY